MQETQEQCLTEQIEHLFQFATADSGQMTFICKLCNALKVEYEDATP